jgi:hypothetical protein
MVYPNSNLPTASQPWGKAIERDLERIQATVTSNEINNRTRDAQLMAAQQRLSAQVVGIAQVAADASSAAAQAQSAAAQAQQSIELANEAITQIQYILGILQEPQPPTTSSSGSWVASGPASIGGTVLSVTINNPGSYANVDLSASVSFTATAENTGNATSGTFYIGDGTTNNSPSSWSMPTGSGTYPKTNSYSQTYTKTYTTGSSKTINLYLSTANLPSEFASVAATVNVSGTWY